jgi:hypothetical protein
MNLVEIMQEKDLRISFSSITGFGPLGGLSNFYHNQVAAVVLATENKKKQGKTYGTTCLSNSYNPEYTLP